MCYIGARVNGRLVAGGSVRMEAIRAKEWMTHGLGLVVIEAGLLGRTNVCYHGI